METRTFGMIEGDVERAKPSTMRVPLSIGGFLAKGKFGRALNVVILLCLIDALSTAIRLQSIMNNTLSTSY